MSKTIYTHKHHIIPRHAGGSNDPSNLIELTIEEHALAHKKLFFIYGRWQDEIAYLTLSGQISSAEAIKQAQSKGASRPKTEETKRKLSISAKNRPPITEETRKKLKERTGEKNGFYGKTHTKETKEKLRKINSDGRHIGEKNGFYGKTHTKETKEKLRAAATGRIDTPETKEKRRLSALKRWKNRHLKTI